MYILLGKILGRGFSLEKSNRKIFRTTHKLGFLPSSYVSIDGDRISLKPKNMIVSKLSIFKNGYEMGEIDLHAHFHATISLKTKEGEVDRFKFEDIPFAQTFILSNSKAQILKFSSSLNPLLLREKFTIEVLSDIFPREAIEELIFYSGEILFRKPSVSSPSSF